MFSSCLVLTVLLDPGFVDLTSCSLHHWVSQIPVPLCVYFCPRGRQPINLSRAYSSPTGDGLTHVTCLYFHTYVIPSAFLCPCICSLLLVAAKVMRGWGMRTF